MAHTENGTTYYTGKDLRQEALWALKGRTCGDGHSYRLKQWELCLGKSNVSLLITGQCRDGTTDYSNLAI